MLSRLALNHPRPGLSLCARSTPNRLHLQIGRRKLAHLRCFSVFSRSSTTKEGPASQVGNINGPNGAIYHGPLARTFRSLKIFSLSSMGLAIVLTPFMFIIETSLPNIARFALAATALTTSGVSTAMVAWCGQPYVAKAYALGDGHQGNNPMTSQSLAEGVKLETYDIFLRPRFTSVYDTSFLAESRRPFAKWELAESLSVQKPDADVPPEETVAETTTADGRVLGRWIVSWDEKRMDGTCRAEGRVQRYVTKMYAFSFADAE